MSTPFIHLHAHSHYSFLRGLASPHALAQAAAGAGMGALAFPSAQESLLRSTTLGRALGAAEAYRWLASILHQSRRTRIDVQ
ncbi:MAG: hypothetical protein HY872_11420 [Chloroflexi bacterium]|nr:hypothetical protein [Chloroflexota bacterium]